MSKKQLKFNLSSTATAPRWLHLVTLCFIRFFSSIAYAALFSSLLLYLVNHFKLDSAYATELVGTFVSLNYVLPLVGGFIADRYLSLKSLFITGNVIRALGCIILAYAGLTNLYFGLALFLIGSLVGSVGINLFVTKLFAKDEVESRKRAFYWNYSAMSCGFLMGFSFAGLFGMEHDYQSLFLISSFFSMIPALLAVFLPRSKCSLSNREKIFFINWNNFRGVGCILLPLVFLIFILKYAFFLDAPLLILTLIGLSVVFYFSLINQNKINKKKIVLFLLFMMMSVVFWSMYMLTPTALMLFIQKDVNTTIAGFNIAPQWLDNIDSIILILGGALLPISTSYLNRKFNFSISSEQFFSVGLACVSLSMFVLYFGLQMISAKTQLPISWVIAYLAFMSLGELFIGPNAIALVGELIPDSLTNIMMGVWSLTIGIGSVIAGFISRTLLLPDVGNTISSANFYSLSHVFSLGMFLIGSMVSTLCITLFITGLFSKDEQELCRKALFRNYSIMNAGLLIGFSLAGFFDLSHDYKDLFLIVSFFSMISALLSILLPSRKRSISKNDRIIDINWSNFLGVAYQLIANFYLHRFIYNLLIFLENSNAPNVALKINKSPAALDLSSDHANYHN